MWRIVSQKYVHKHKVRYQIDLTGIMAKAFSIERPFYSLWQMAEAEFISINEFEDSLPDLMLFFEFQNFKIQHTWLMGSVLSNYLKGTLLVPNYKSYCNEPIYEFKIFRKSYSGVRSRWFYSNENYWVGISSRTFVEIDTYFNMV
jgi:hypothetical protein